MDNLTQSLAVNIIDLILAIILLIGAWLGYRRGLLRNIINIVATILTFVLGFFFGAELSLWLESEFGLHTLIFNNARHMLEQMPGLAGGSPSLDPLSDLIAKLREYRLPQATVDFLEEQLRQITENVIGQAWQNASSLLAGIFADMLISAIAFFLIMLLVSLVANLLMLLLKYVGLIKGVLDSMAGLCLGLAQTLLLLSLVLAVLVPYLATQPPNELLALFNQSFLVEHILKLFYTILAWR